MTDFTAIDPAVISPLESYRTLLHCVSPRPIALTSTISIDGIPNLAPFSFFMAGGANPPSIVISPTTTGDGHYKHTLKNILATGEFVVNAVTFDMSQAMNRTSESLPEGTSEWDVSGFTRAACVRVKPARVHETPLALECKLYKVVPHGTGPYSANYVIGEIVYMHVANYLLDEDGRVDATRVDYISRMGGDWYTRSSKDSMFEMDRP